MLQTFCVLEKEGNRKPLLKYSFYVLLPAWINGGYTFMVLSGKRDSLPDDNISISMMLEIDDNVGEGLNRTIRHLNGGNKDDR